MQKILSENQIKSFYHQNFVEDQVRDFIGFFGAKASDNMQNVMDIGGGCGFFAKYLQKQSNYSVGVLEMDPISVKSCRDSGIFAVLGDALNPEIKGDLQITAFNLILHHLVGATNCQTQDLQKRALDVWRPHVKAIFVNEYIYESYVNGFSGRLIYAITKSSILSWIGRVVSLAIPSLRANTFGVGVRFRSHEEWVNLFESCGYVVKLSTKGKKEHVSLARRLLLIKQIRRDSFCLVPQSIQ
jgi:hypothetical protein